MNVFLAHLTPDLLPAFSAAVGILLLYTEFSLIKYNAPVDPDTQADVGLLFFFGPWSYFFIRATWYALGLFLLLYGLCMFRLTRMPGGIPAFDNFDYAICAGMVIGVLRLAFVRYTVLYSTPHTALVGWNRMGLVGQRGILVKDVTPAVTGTIRLENPVYKNDEIDCIADDAISAGTYVQIIEIDCDLVKVTRATSHVHAPSA